MDQCIATAQLPGGTDISVCATRHFICDRAPTSLNVLAWSTNRSGRCNGEASATANRDSGCRAHGPGGLRSMPGSLICRLPCTRRGRVAEYVQRWGHVRLFSPFGMNSSPLGRAIIRAEKHKYEFPEDTDCITGREHFRKYLEPLAGSAMLKGAIVNEVHVLKVGRRGLLKGELAGDTARGRPPFRLLPSRHQGQGTHRRGRDRSRLHRYLWAASLARRWRHSGAG